MADLHWQNYSGGKVEQHLQPSTTAPVITGDLTAAFKLKGSAERINHSCISHATSIWGLSGPQPKQALSHAFLTAVHIALPNGRTGPW